jgi:hypothetical protein
MPYSISALIIRQSEERAYSGHNWPFVTLAGGLSLIPLDRDYVFLTEGDGTTPRQDFEFTPPQWLSEMASCFSRCAYIEAEIWGGTGIQASVVLEQSRISEPVISSGAINLALRQMGIDDEFTVTYFGLLTSTGKDPFDVVGLGRHRSVSGWFKESVERGAAGNSRNYMKTGAGSLSLWRQTAEANPSKQ